MAVPPTTVPSWDDNDTNSTAPPSQIQNDGLPETSQLPNSYLNWILRWLVEWVQFMAVTLGIEFFDVEHDPADGTHTSITADDVSSTGLIESTAGDVEALAGTVKGQVVAATSLLSTQRAVSGGTVLRVGGQAANIDGMTRGAGTATEEEGPIYDIPADTLQPRGTYVRVRAQLRTQIAAGTTLTIRLRLGDSGVGIGARSLLLSYIDAAPTNLDEYAVDCMIRVLNTGNPLSLEGWQQIRRDSGGTGTLATFKNLESTAPEDGTGTLRLSMSVQYSVANAGNNSSIRYMIVEVGGE